jgi:hypothetical protein
MKLFRVYLLAVCILPLMVSCGTVGKDFDSSKIKKIRNNVTTQLEVINWFGVPFKEGTENNYTMWIYQTDTWQVIGEGQSKGLVILFDEKNIVKAHRYESNY